MSDPIIAQWQETIRPLAPALERASGHLGEIEHPLGYLYQQAEAAGDATAMQAILDAWGNAQALAEQLPPFVAALQGGTAAITELRAQRDVAIEEINDLMDAITSINKKDPRLQALVEALNEDFRDAFMGDAWHEAEAYVADLYADQFHEYLTLNYTTSHWAVGTLIEALQGEADLDEQQQQLIQELLDTFAPEGVRHGT